VFFKIIVHYPIIPRTFIHQNPLDIFYIPLFHMGMIPHQQRMSTRDHVEMIIEEF
jgi:hypothetical protein